MKNITFMVLAFLFAASTCIASESARHNGDGCCNDNGTIANVIAASQGPKMVRAIGRDGHPAIFIQHDGRNEEVRNAPWSPEDRPVGFQVVKRCHNSHAAEFVRRRRDERRNNDNRRPHKPRIGDPDYCTVTVYRRMCHVISNNPYLEQCYWYPMHTEGIWNEKRKCCQVTVDGRDICTDSAIYQPW